MEQISSNQLEKLVIQFGCVVELVLQRYGREITERQMVLKRLADVSIDLYAMTAVLSRASRSYCIGLRNAEHEVSL